MTEARLVRSSSRSKSASWSGLRSSTSVSTRCSAPGGLREGLLYEMERQFRGLHVLGDGRRRCYRHDIEDLALLRLSRRGGLPRVGVDPVGLPAIDQPGAPLAETIVEVGPDRLPGGVDNRGDRRVAEVGEDQVLGV